MNIAKYLNFNFSLIFVITTAFMICYLFIPTIVRMSRFKKLFDYVDDRKIHTENVPRLGGIAVFAGFIISILLFSDFKNYSTNSFIAGALILLFIGLKDDILVISPLTKFSGQFIAVAVVVFFGKSSISNLYGFFGINQISEFFSIFITIFIFLTTINAFNFIDGIDGLSSSLGVISSFALGFWFICAGFLNFALISFALTFSLLAFLRFNLLPSKNKIFLGDTGSMIIGFALTYLVVKFLESNLLLGKNSKFFILPAPAFAISVMILPYFDLIRIVFVRLIRGKKPYEPDMFHLHHLFLKLRFNHRQITLIYSVYTILFILLVFWLSKFVSIRRLLLLEFIITLFLSFIPEYIAFKQKK